MKIRTKLSRVTLAVALVPGALFGQGYGRHPINPAQAAQATQPAMPVATQPAMTRASQPAMPLVSQAPLVVPARPAVQVATRPTGVYLPPQRVQISPPAPAVPPRVTCDAGLVTVRAENSTLANVLHGVAHCAGTIVHMPAEIGATRVVANYGPVEPMTLFAALLDGSADYVIIGSKRDLSSVKMVIVKPHQAMLAAAQPVAQGRAKAPSAPATFIDEEGVERLPSGLTPEEANMTPEELAQKFEAARQEQKRLDQLAQPQGPKQ